MILTHFLISICGRITDLGATYTTTDVDHRKKTRATEEHDLLVSPELGLVFRDFEVLHLECGEWEENCLGQRICQKHDG